MTLENYLVMAKVLTHEKKSAHTTCIAYVPDRLACSIDAAVGHAKR